MSQRRLDLPTFLLLLAHVFLLAASLTLACLGILPLWGAFVLSLLSFNLAFTLWHECAHYTLSSSKALCSGVGVLLSFISFFPGYFALRRDHLLHHKFEGDPDKDPVYPRVQCRPWAFPFRLAWTILVNPQPRNDDQPLRAGERLADLAVYLAFVAAASAAIWFGYGWVLLFGWVLPRLVILPIHAFYVCYLPHSGHGQGTYRRYRVVLRNPLTRYLTLYHAYHGIHHLWPGIPWHQYRRTFRERRAELEAKGVEILPNP